MDIEKAIDCLKADKEYLTDMKITICRRNEVAVKTLEAMKKQFLGETRDILDVAIKALEEVEQYRAIGTLEGYERAIESSIENYNLYREYKAKVQEYRAIGTVEECRENKEFLDFLYNRINPNDMEQYLSMYNCSDEKIN